jgi:hypothetical protein
MPDEAKVPPPERAGGPAAQADLSLGQALLAPLDAIFTAQLHAARSFINMLLQLGFPHTPTQKDKEVAGEEAAKAPEQPVAASLEKHKPGRASDEPFTLDFFHTATIDGKKRRQKISVPALALVPVAPLAVQQASFRLEFTIKSWESRRQLRDSATSSEVREKPRPWYLVDEPIEIKGSFAPRSGVGEGQQEEEQRQSESTIQVEVRIGAIPMPSGLEKLLVALTQISSLEDDPRPDEGGGAQPQPAPQAPQSPGAATASEHGASDAPSKDAGTQP